MLELMLFKASGELFFYKESIELAEALKLLDPCLTVEIRHGFAALTSGVKLIPSEELTDYGFDPVQESFGFVYSNGHHKLIEAQTIWKVSQIIPDGYQKPEWRSG